MIKFILEKKDGKARAGKILTSRSSIETPVFMPVGTKGTVKAMIHKILDEIGFDIILGNTYHLYLRPGIELIKKFDGLHNFISWKKSILTDSGGFQVFSLDKGRKDKKSLVKLSNEGVYFKDHLQGDTHLFTPEFVIEIQEIFGSDIMMPLDICLSPNSSYEDFKKALYKTVDWLDKSIKSKKTDQALFGIIQGGIFEDLRIESAKLTTERALDGYAIGGLSVGESKDIMYNTVRILSDYLPDEKPHYLMGVGRPEDILEAIENGIDMFDCVIPTRGARTGLIFTSKGELNLRQERYKEDKRPLDDCCSCYTCQNFSRAYLRHLFMSEEISSYILNTIHNLTFFKTLTKNARAHILNGTFKEFKKETLLGFKNTS